MIPIAPEISTRIINPADTDFLADLLVESARSIPYSRPYDGNELRRYLFDGSKSEDDSESRICMGAWRAGRMIGYIDASVGNLDSEFEFFAAINPVANITLPGAQDQYLPPSGLLRLLILPEEPDMAEEVAHHLIEQAEQFWQGAGVKSVRAFRLGSGYPHLQAGAGILPGDWSNHFRLLTVAGYKLEQRYRTLMKPLSDYMVEIYPQLSISLETRELENGWESALYHRRLHRIGVVRLVGAELIPGWTEEDTVPKSGEQMQQSPSHANVAKDQAVPVATISNLQIDTEWRGQDLGKLLLRRAINDARHRGYRQMLVYLRQPQHVGWSLLTQQGFEELSFRGYSFLKALGD